MRGRSKYKSSKGCLSKIERNLNKLNKLIIFYYNKPNYKNNNYRLK